MKLLIGLLIATAVAATPLNLGVKSRHLQKRDDCPDSADNSYENIMLYNFNLHRDNHSAPYFEWNQTLADAALVTTQKPTLAHDK